MYRLWFEGSTGCYHLNIEDKYVGKFATLKDALQAITEVETHNDTLRKKLNKFRVS